MLASQDSLLKLLTGMCNDVCPLNFRSETEKDYVTLDPYFKVAPGWSTLSGGRRPYITAAPVDIVENLQRAASCVPLIASTRVFVVDAQGNKQEVTREELQAMNIEVQTVPNLYRQAAAAGGTSTANQAPAAPAIDLSPLMERQRVVEMQVASMQALLEKIAAAAVPVAAAPGVGASSSAASPPLAPAEDDDDEPIGSNRAGKRPRRV